MRRKLKLEILFAALFGTVLVGYFLFVNRPGRRSFQEYVALDGSEPWGPLVPPSPDPPGTVIVYRIGRARAVCFDAFHSAELRAALDSKNGKQVTVEYDTFSDFGKIRGYNVHSIDGVVLANGYHVLRPEFAGTSGVELPGPGAVSQEDCW